MGFLNKLADMGGIFCGVLVTVEVMAKQNPTSRESNKMALKSLACQLQVVSPDYLPVEY